MKTILVKYYSPSEVLGTTESLSDSEIKKACFRACKYGSETDALWAYAETPCTWSVLLDESINVQDFIDEAYNHIKANTDEDYDWLVHNFTLSTVCK